MAAEDNNTELLPLLDSDEPFFDIGLRGYDKRQVDDHVARAAAEIAELRQARDVALATSADRAAQLASREAHIESLKAQASKVKDTPLSQANVSDRIREMLQLATDEAAQTRRTADDEAAEIRRTAESEAAAVRRTAEEEAERVLASARADAERVRGEAAAEQQRLIAAASQRSAEADQKLAQARVQAKTELDKAHADAGQLLELARTERDLADAEALEARTRADKASSDRIRTAEEDFEITLRSRRSVAEREAREQQAAVHAEAERTVRDAQQRADALAAEREETYRSLQDLHQRLGAVIARD